MKKWEHKILTDDDNVNFELLGDAGWELVSVVFCSWENFRKGGWNSEITYYFKREKK